MQAELMAKGVSKAGMAAAAGVAEKAAREAATAAAAANAEEAAADEAESGGEVGAACRRPQLAKQRMRSCRGHRKRV